MMRTCPDCNGYGLIYGEFHCQMCDGCGDVDIYPAGRPTHTEKQWAERLHKRLIEVEEAQEDPLATAGLIADILIIGDEDIPVFGVLKNVNNPTESFLRGFYAIGSTTDKAIDNAIAKIREGSQSSE